MEIENQYRPNEPEGNSPIFTAVGTSRRRSILASLIDYPTAMSERGLALTLAKNGDEIPETDVSPENARRIRTDLYHKHLPLLEDSDLIEWNREGEIVQTTEHPVFEDPKFRQLVRMEGDGVDEALSELADSRRRVLLAIVRECKRSISKAALAREIIQREEDTEPGQESVNEIVVALSHIHLPKLDGVDIIEYNPATERVAYMGHSGLEELILLFNRPTNSVVERLDGFLGGLLTTYTNASGNSMDDPLGWPSSWSHSHHG